MFLACCLLTAVCVMLMSAVLLALGVNGNAGMTPHVRGYRGGVGVLCLWFLVCGFVVLWFKVCGFASTMVRFLMPVDFSRCRDLP
jgi:hypothetical protein